METILLEQIFHFVTWVGCFIKGEYWFIFHVIQIWPHGIQRNLVWFKLFYYIRKHVKIFVSPPWLVMSHRPEWWNMSWTNELVIFLQQSLRIFITNKNNKLYIFSLVMVLHRFSTLTSFQVKCMSGLEINHVKESWVLASQVNRLMTIGLAASAISSKINLKGSISVPNTPDTIFYFEFLLKTLTHSPFFRCVLWFDDCVITSPLHNTVDRKNSRIVGPSDNFNELAIVGSVAYF